jgi:hypothetical protein
MRVPVRTISWVFPGFLLALSGSVRAADAELSASEVFARRLLPIFKSPNPSSCVQCHLAGVDLKDYILPDHEKTFRSLRDQGLIDLDAPRKSKILQLIRRGGDAREGAALIHARTRQAEYEAFAAWIEACCADPGLRKAAKLDDKERARPALPVEVIRHGRTDRLLESFERNVWAIRFRCMNCHTEGTPQNEKLRQEHGPRVAWVKQAGPQATMDYLLTSRLIDTGEPEKSLLLRKPLGTVKHGGGIKFLVGDQAYKSVRTWIEDVAAIREKRYTSAADLPRPETGPLRFGSDIWLKLANTPPEWGDRLLQVQVYAWDRDKAGWESEPIATSDRGVWGKGKLWQHNLTLLAAPGSFRAQGWQKGPSSLPNGRYRVKVHVDRKGRLGRDWKASWTEEDYAGQAEFEARWREGYGAMTVVEAGTVRR